MIDLVEFLKSLVMTTVVIDKKFRETLPALISKFKTFVEDSDHGEAKTKKRKPKKIKLGKDGLYPAEEEHIRFWWNTHKSTDPEEKSATGEGIGYHISCLRRRETQLQMIIILEILALEPLARPKDNTDDSQLPGQESQGTLTNTTEGPAKKRSKHNYPVLLDVHADRLCIWQSTTLDEVKALAESQDQATKSEKANSDPLKDFCVDIILPL
jgi:DNA replication regulator SLD3